MKSRFRKILIAILLLPSVWVENRASKSTVGRYLYHRDLYKICLNDNSVNFAERFNSSMIKRYFVLYTNVLAKIVYYEGVETCIKRFIPALFPSRLRREVHYYFYNQEKNTIVTWPVKACNVEIKSEFSSVRHGRVAVFASYSQSCIIPEYVIYYLNELKKVVDNIIMISDNPIFPEELRKLDGLVCYASFFNHGEYDFGSYKRGYIFAEQAGLLKESEELIFCNDSCYGPVRSLSYVFDKMDSKDYDFWGLIDSNETQYHILSFYYVFKKNVFTNTAFANFVHSFSKQEKFIDYVMKYERQFTAILMNEGFKCGCYVDIPAEVRSVTAKISGNGNLTLFPCLALKNNLPFIKRKVFSGAYGASLYESPVALLALVKEINSELVDIINREVKNNAWTYDDKWHDFDTVIDSYDVVSFDIFDTLLTRPFIEPTDLFLKIEQDLKLVDFYKKRVSAEAKARVVFSSQADVTLTQIYDQIHIDRKNECMDYELTLEAAYLRANPFVKNIYEAAVKKNKQIIAVSDMYLPKSFLQKVLTLNGYTKINHVFVSCEENACKYNGKLFEVVLARLGLNSKQVIHFGDNFIADKQAPSDRGLRGVHLPSIRENFQSNPANAKFSSSEGRGLSMSAILTFIGKYRELHSWTDPYEDLGYIMGGPFAVGYCQFIHEESQKEGIDNLLFVSRDGYALNKVYNKIFNYPIPNAYVYASRTLINKTFPAEKRTIAFKKFILESCRGTKLFDANDIEVAYVKYETEINEYLRANLEQYYKYLSGLNICGNRIASVDMTTLKFSSLKFLQKIYNEKYCLGFFTTTFKNDDVPYRSYSGYCADASKVPFLELSEELITAPEFPVASLKDGNPVFDDWNIIERNRLELYKKVLSGVLRFADDFYNQFGETSIKISFNDNERLFSNFVSHCNFSDRNILNNLYHTFDSSGLVYKTLYESIFNVKN